MREKDVRNWLGLYSLLMTSILGAIIIITGKAILRLDDVQGVFYIIMPVLIGQLTTISIWYTRAAKPKTNPHIDFPAWLVKAPPIIVIFILVVLICLKIILYDKPNLAISDNQFKVVVTFSLALLNATTAIVMSRFFNIPKGGN